MTLNPLDWLQAWIPAIILGIIAFLAYLYSNTKSKEKTVRAVKKALKIFITALPIFVVALMLTGLFYSPYIMPEWWVRSILGSQSGFLGIWIGTLMGFPMPGPRYAIYPLAQVLLLKGAGYGTIGALICGQQIIDVPEGCFIEMKMLGARFFIVRTLISVAVVFIAGVIIEIIYAILIFFGFVPYVFTLP